VWGRSQCPGEGANNAFACKHAPTASQAPAGAALAANNRAALPYAAVAGKPANPWPPTLTHDAA